jgi:ubiquinone/menaquinone biosynthesis C-methylase UbiE
MFNIRRKISHYKYRFVNSLKKEKLLVLEVGIGNDAPLIFKRYYPQAVYDGLDIDLNYNLSKESINFLNKFYQIDLEKTDLNEIEDNYYDYIICAHVIEHLCNGEEIVDKLSRKIKKDGLIYFEYPSEKSKKLPSKRGSLNFYDDKTHKNTYDINRLRKILIANNFKIIRSGNKRDLIRIVLFPYIALKTLYKNGYIGGFAYWDMLGFADYILAKRS